MLSTILSTVLAIAPIDVSDIHLPSVENLPDISNVVIETDESGATTVNIPIGDNSVTIPLIR